MKKLCLILFIAASLAGAAPRGSFFEHYHWPGLWMRPIAPDPVMLPIFAWLMFRGFFMM